MISNQEQYINLSTRKRDGSFVDTPVWFAREGETNNYYIFSMKNAGKIKRIRNFSDVKVAPCTGLGKLKSDWMDAKAELINEPEKIKFSFSVLRGKYGFRFRISDFFSKIFGRYHKRQIVKFSISDE